MKRFLILATLALAGCVTNPTDSAPALKVGLYHEVPSPGMKMRINADHSIDSYLLRSDSTKEFSDRGIVYFARDTVKISRCAQCDTGSFFAVGDTLFMVKSGNRVQANNPPVPWFAKE
jgi:hypothetical protein